MELTRNRMVRAVLAVLLLAVIAVCGLQVFKTRHDWMPEALVGEAQASGPAALRGRGGGFDMSQHSIPLEEIHSGGPPKDGIPAVSNPVISMASEQDFMLPEDRVIGIIVDGKARAYPLRLLNHHECVNDELGGKAIAVTYCPLCDSSAVIDRRIDGKEVEFGISGLLYNSNVLLYDRSDEESLWSQVKMEAVAGPRTGTRLNTYAHELTEWSKWVAEHPDTEVVNLDSGNRRVHRNYDRDPYAIYFTNDQLMFPVNPASDRYPNKTPIIGIRIGDQYKAYPVQELESSGTEIEDIFAGMNLVFNYDKGTDTARVVSPSAESAEGKLDIVYTFWFAWHAMHPETEVYEIS